MPSPTPENAGRSPQDREFVRLLSAHEQRLTGYILSLVPNWADADDIAQDAKIKLWEQFDRYDPAKDFLAWARAIAYYEVLTYRKTASRHAARFSQQFVDLVAEEVTSLEGETADRHYALAECLAELDEGPRQLIWQCYSSDETIKDVAERLGRSVRGTQKSVAKIRLKLEDCIERRIAEEGPA